MGNLVNVLLADRYLVELELGRGGMATVWLARDVRHERPVAIKVLHPELAGAIGIERFVREVRLTARLQHPGIVALLDSGVLPDADGTSLPWYAMAYVAGESLRDRLTREPQLPVEEALRITEDVAAALQAAHREGVIHRDIKPENVLLADGRVYVVDFGIARALIDTGTERLTSTGLAIGTPVYMSPEQASAIAVDARTDQYSLATVLYEMLAGEPPFTGPTAQSIVARRLTEPPRPLRTVRSAVSTSLESAILRGLERVPADRFPDMAAFAAALRSPTAAAVGPRDPARRRWSVAVVAACILVLVAFGLRAGLRRSGEVPPGSRDPAMAALYQRGVQAYDRRTPAGTIDAVAAFKAALQRDSTYAPGWTGLAKTYVRAYQRSFTIPGVPRDSVLQLAVVSVGRALALDPRYADAWATQSLLARQVDPTGLGPILRAARQAVALDSSSAPAWHALAVGLAESGDMDAAMAAWRRCVALGPGYTQGLAFLALGHYWRREYDSAEVWADSTIAVDPNFLLGRQTAGVVAIERGNFTRARADFDAARRLSTAVEVVNSFAGSALVEARAGRLDSARAILRRVEPAAAAYSPTPLHTAVYVAEAYAALGERSRALAWLERYTPREDVHFQLHLRCDPPFSVLAADPRFQSLLLLAGRPAGQGC